MLKSAQLIVTLYKRYLIVSMNIVSWDNKAKCMVQSMDAESDTRPSDERTAEVIKRIANTVTSMLSWTVDYPSAHSSNKLPVLDIQTWVTETDLGTLTNYEFFRKPMANHVAIPAQSALSNSVKFSTYRQEVVRVLKNTAIHLPWDSKAAFTQGFM